MVDYDQDFLSLARMIIEGKDPPKKEKKSDAEETLAKVKKDLGVKDDGKEEGKKKDGESEGSDKGNEDGSTDEGDHPDNPESAGSPDEVPEDDTAQEPPKKEPKKPDLSKDPFKGEKPSEKSDKKGEAPQASKKDDGDTDTSSKEGGLEKGTENGKKEADDGERPSDSSQDDEDSDEADGAKIGKKVGKEDPDGDEEESDNPAGPSGEEIDGSSESEVNLTPKIKDETISERKNLTIVERVQASRLKARALLEAKEDRTKIESFLNEGFPGSIPGEWFKDETGDYHVAVMFEDGIRDFVFEKHIGFEKLKGELSREGGVKDPGGLARWIGNRKYGKAKMNKAAKEHKSL